MDKINSIINHPAADDGEEILRDVQSLHEVDSFPITISIARLISKRPVNPLFGNRDIRSAIVSNIVCNESDL